MNVSNGLPTVPTEPKEENPRTKRMRPASLRSDHDGPIGVITINGSKCTGGPEGALLGGRAIIGPSPTTFVPESPLTASKPGVRVCMALVEGYKPNTASFDVLGPKGELIKLRAELVATNGERRSYNGAGFVV